MQNRTNPLTQNYHIDYNYGNSVVHSFCKLILLIYKGEREKIVFLAKGDVHALWIVLAFEYW